MASRIGIDLTGRRFGHWTVLSRMSDPRPGSYWLAACACGTRKTVRGQSLRGGQSTSCGCFARQMNKTWLEEAVRSAAKRRAEARGKDSIPAPTRAVPEYATWRRMKNRCLNPKVRCYPHYGGRGITVCERWMHSFAAFYSDMGPKPSPKHSIDRIDVNGNYEPSNCRWATTKEQALNKRPRAKRRAA